MSDEPVPAPSDPLVAADEIILYGVRMNNPTANPAVPATLAYADNTVEMSVTDINGLVPNSVVALVYAYAYAGKCYRLDRTKIYVFIGASLVVVGCSFTNPYQMWRVRAKDLILELTPSEDTAEKLILVANIPGRRLPNTYDSHMELSTRGGRVNGG